MKNKNNARTGGAVLSPSNKELDFINTGHAAQSRYLAALANPFASPAVPIPDSFLTAHVSKIAKESVLDNVSELRIDVRKVSEEPTGDYRIEMGYTNTVTGYTILGSYDSEVGLRLVASGLSFEDIGKRDDLQGVVTYKQNNLAYTYAGGPNNEIVSTSERTARNDGFGTILYELQRRQALEFEGNARTFLSITFSEPVSIIARFVALIEYDGAIGISEQRFSNKNFIISDSYQNHHAGVFADTPHPDLNHALVEPSHTDIQEHNPGHHSTALTAAAHWVSSAAGWLWKHRGEAANIIRKAPEYYNAMTRYGGSVMSASGRIAAIGARAAPLAIAL